MQVKTERGIYKIGNQERPTVSLAIAPRATSAHLIVGLAIGALLGFVAGSALTLLVGEKSLLLVQHLWNRLTNATNADGERVHFELLLQ
ncbi:MAG: hypothetical protein ABIO92_10300 [Chloroflexia bacterium]